jgi:TonB family protein
MWQSCQLRLSLLRIIAISNKRGVDFWSYRRHVSHPSRMEKLIMNEMTASESVQALGPVSVKVRMRATLVFGSLVVASVISIAACAFIGHLNTQLWKRLNDEHLKRGDYIPMLSFTSAFSPEVSDITISKLHPTVLYLFSPDCSACARQKTTLEAICTGVTAFGYDMLAVSVSHDGISTMFSSPPSFPVVYSRDADLFRNLRLSGTPSFLLVSPIGKVLAVHEGLWTKDKMQREFAPALLSSETTISQRGRPSLLYMPDTRLTPSAKAAGFNGFAMATLVVDESGNPQAIRLSKHLGFGLDEEALKALQHARFLPALQNGTPQAMRINIQVAFSD